MRIHRATIVALVLVAGACGGPEQSANRGSDVLFLQTASGVTVIGSAASHPTFQSGSAVPAGDWSTIVQTQRDGDSTDLIGVDPLTGTEVWERSVTGNLQTKVVSPDGGYVALVPGHQRYAAQTHRTQITVSGRDIQEPITVDLRGNFEPEAFSTDGETLFVVQYLPANNPSRYQVRQLDIAKGRVRDVFSVDKELQEAMRGTARVQEMSSDGRRLYTLYTTRTKQGTHSFIHVLALDEGWAHCIDLPHGFALSGEKRTALTVRADGERIYVADTHEGSVVEVDAQRLEVVRQADMDLTSAWPGATMTFDEDADRLYVGSGDRVVAASVEGFQEIDAWELGYEITGIQVGKKSRRLYVGLIDGVASIDLETGAKLETWDPPGVASIKSLGPATPRLDPARTKIVCGC